MRRGRAPRSHPSSPSRCSREPPSHSQFIRGLLRWLAQAELVPDDVLDELKARVMPGELDIVADQTRALREWFRAFVHKRMGRLARYHGIAISGGGFLGT